MVVDVIFKFVEMGVPALAVLGGIMFMFIGLTSSNGGMVGLGLLMFVIGILVFMFKGKASGD